MKLFALTEIPLFSSENKFEQLADCGKFIEEEEEEEEDFIASLQDVQVKDIVFEQL